MNLQQLKSLLDILLAAAAADGHTDREETATVRRLLSAAKNLSDAERTELEAHQWAFEPGQFKLEDSIRGLGALAAEDKQAVLSLLEEVEFADGIIDLAEEEFLARVAAALGVDSAAIQMVEQEPPPMPEVKA
ncbi:MAG: TerB family tellurite resistance protein [Myxococcota bacterium]|jgi:uncharacterized tellurite resistance protein B-like protein|nr:TerB family tellurite resistance protein [Myxococcota bacterium]